VAKKAPCHFLNVLFVITGKISTVLHTPLFQSTGSFRFLCSLIHQSMNAMQKILTLCSKLQLAVVLVSFTLFTACKKDKTGPDQQDNDTEITIKLNGKEYHYTGEASVSSDGQVNIDFMKKNTIPFEFVGSISWKGGTGNYTWNGSSNFWWEPDGMNPTREHHHLYDDGKKISPGKIAVTKLEGIGGFVTGTFVIEQSGATNTQSGNGEYLGASRVEGSFKVKRGL
jgi:hypothetical protein